MAEKIAWSVKIEHTTKMINDAPKIEAGVYDSHEEVKDLLNEKFDLEKPYTLASVKSLYQKKQKELQLVNKRDGEMCKVTLWNIS